MQPIDQFPAQATLMIVVPFVMQWLKQQSWFPFLTVETQTLNRVAASLVAFCSGVGILATFHAGTLTLSGLTWYNLLHALYLGAVQFIGQHFVYKTAIAPPLPGVMQHEKSTRLGPALPKVDPTEEQK